MEEGTKTKKTVFVGGFGDDVDESVLYESFSPFGGCFFPPSPATTDHVQQVISSKYSSRQRQRTPPRTQVRQLSVRLISVLTSPLEPKHRGFAFVTYASPADAQDAIDNMDLNELRGRVIKVNIARPIKAAIQPGAGNRASMYFISQRLPLNSHHLHSLGVGRLVTAVCKTTRAKWR